MKRLIKETGITCPRCYRMMYNSIFRINTNIKDYSYSTNVKYCLACGSIKNGVRMQGIRTTATKIEKMLNVSPEIGLKITGIEIESC